MKCYIERGVEMPARGWGGGGGGGGGHWYIYRYTLIEFCQNGIRKYLAIIASTVPLKGLASRHELCTRKEIMHEVTYSTGWINTFLWDNITCRKRYPALRED